jgi:hypothetical protein
MKSEFDFTPPSLELLPKNGENEETWEIDFKNGVALWEAWFCCKVSDKLILR